MKTQENPISSENSIPIDIDSFFTAQFNHAAMMSAFYPQLKALKKAYLSKLRENDPEANFNTHSIEGIDSNALGNFFTAFHKIFNQYIKASFGLIHALEVTRNMFDEDGNILVESLSSLESEHAVSLKEDLIDPINERLEIGAQEYGSPLSTFNGRDGILDFKEEFYDSISYAAQVYNEFLQSLSSGKEVIFPEDLKVVSLKTHETTQEE